MTGRGDSFVQVAVQRHLNRLFTYHLSDEAVGLVSIGDRVLIDFAGKIETGVVVSFGNPEGIKETKPVIAPIDLFPFLSGGDIELAQFVSEYYFSPIGETISAMVPGNIGISCEDVFTISDKGAEMYDAWVASEKTTGDMMRYVASHGLVSFSDMRERFGDFEVLTPLRELVNKKLISVRRFITDKRRLWKDGYLTPTPKLITEGEVLTGKKRTEFVSEMVRAGRVDFTYALERYKRRLIDEMLRGGFIFFHLDGEKGAIPDKPLLPSPTNEQAVALKQLKKTLSEKGISLVFGVAGSGKTYLYIRMADEVLRRGKNVIVLVPEISLTPQAIERYTDAFGDVAYVTHSNMTMHQRFEVWRSAKLGISKLIIGPRSAIFAPFDNLGLIVVDEEHDASYKQSDTDPRYNARDVALYLSRRYGIPVILGSSTPSLESYHRAITGRYNLCVLKHRVLEYPMPAVKIVDMRRADRHSKSPIFSIKLVSMIEEAISKGRQVILLQNRRGFATVAICKKCGFTIRCRNCDVTMTYHKATGRLLCHYCHYKRSVPKKCPECGEEAIELLGFGTERVVEGLNEVLGEVKIGRMDTDATRKRGVHTEILSDFEAGRYQVLVGTQMVSKGLDYPNVTLVGVINADTSLMFPDFRAGERTYQLIAQVVGRSGRSAEGGEAIIQTFHPLHYSIELASKLDYVTFFEREMEYRRRLVYPPYSRVGVILIEDRRSEKARERASAVREVIVRGGVGEKVRVLGPAPAPISRLRGYYRWQILLFAKRAVDIHSIVKASGLKFGRYSKYGRVVVDIDPVDLL